MKRYLHALVCLIAALHLVGGHWGVMQMVAWATMVAEYTEERGLLTGVKETFDGEHPCPMCKKIAAGKQKEDKENLPTTKLWQECLVKWYQFSPTAVMPQADWREVQSLVSMQEPATLVGRGDAAPPVPPPERLI